MKMVYYEEPARKIPVIDTVDVLVAGSGPAGFSAAVCGKRATPYGTEYLVRRGAVPAGTTLGQVGIEELFVFMAKEA